VVDTLQGTVSGVVNALRGTPIHGSPEVRLESFPIRILNQFASGLRTLVRESRQYQPNGKKVTQSMLRLIDATSALFGLPTGGLTQLTSTTAGLGKKEDTSAITTTSRSPIVRRVGD